MSDILSPLTHSSSILFKVITLEALIEHKNLVLGIPDLTTDSHVIIDNFQTIWIYKQAFALYSDAWKWVCQIENKDARRACNINLV